MNKCLLCQSEWGNFWGKVDGSEHFFCCEHCHKQYLNLYEAIQFQTGWGKIDRIILSSTTRLRTGSAYSGDMKMQFEVSFDLNGEIWSFKPTFE